MRPNRASSRATGQDGGRVWGRGRCDAERSARSTKEADEAVGRAPERVGNSDAVLHYKPIMADIDIALVDLCDALVFLLSP